MNRSIISNQPNQNRVRSNYLNVVDDSSSPLLELPLEWQEAQDLISHLQGCGGDPDIMKGIVKKLRIMMEEKRRDGINNDKPLD